MTEAISPQFLYFLIIAGAALGGAIIGWSIRSGRCLKQVQVLESHIDNSKQQILARDQEINDKHRKITILTGELARVRGDSELYASRWKTQLQKNRQLSPYQTWVSNLQQKLAKEKTRHSQNRAYAETMAAKYAVTRDNLNRAHSQLTATTKHAETFKQWTLVFQSRLKQRNSEYRQLEDYASKLKETHHIEHEQLNRAHDRLATLNRKNQDYLSWIKVFQSRNLKHKTELGQLRNYAHNIANQLTVTKDNLHRTHQRITEIDHSNQQLSRKVTLWKDWTTVFQSKLKRRNVEYKQLRSYATDTATRLSSSKQNLAAVHSRLTEIDGKQQPLKTWIRVLQNKLRQRDADYAKLEQYRVDTSNQLTTTINQWKDWTTVFQSKLKRRNIEYQQLRNYARDTATRLSTSRQNLSVVHHRLTEIDGKQQPLKTWIRVLQNKFKKNSTDYKQLRHYADNIGRELITTKQNLRHTHDRLTAVEREANYLKKQVGGLVVAEVPRQANVPDNRSLRLMDKIRLFGTSKSDILGRASNQFRQERIEAAQRERTLVSSCEEKDAIIADLKQEIRRLDKLAQRGPSVASLDQSVRIKELQAELTRREKEVNRLPTLEQLIKEHELTIDAFRYKLCQLSANDPAPEPSSPPVKKKSKKKTVKTKSVTRKRQDPDDLKKINGIGPKLEKILNEHGLYTFAQVAALTQKDIQVLSTKLGSFKDRIKRDDWVGKARNLHKTKYGSNS